MSATFKYVAAKCVATVALLPAALNPSLIASAGGITLSLCGAAAGANVTAPAGAPTLPGSDGAACCAKGCHTSQERKRSKVQKMA